MTTDTITKPATKTKVSFPSMWRVILHNDDFTPMDFVTRLLIDLFGKSVEEATELMLTVHLKGRAQIALYTKEVAQQKVIEVRRLAEAHQHPLLATSEEA